MESERIAGDPVEASYLIRQAILVWEVYQDAPWPLETRKGAAWHLLLYGVWTHRFVPRSNVPAAAILKPDEDFFEKIEQDRGLDTLIDLLNAAYVHASEAPRELLRGLIGPFYERHRLD